MKTTDLIYENQKKLNAMQDLVLQSKKHIEFLAANAPEIRTNLESVAESMQRFADMLENQIVFNRDTRVKFAKEFACKNQAYDFIGTEKLIGRFKTFCECCPTNLYAGSTGVEIMQDK
jgi:hypothetical protein